MVKHSLHHHCLRSIFVETMLSSGTFANKCPVKDFSFNEKVSMVKKIQPWEAMSYLGWSKFQLFRFGMSHTISRGFVFYSHRKGCGTSLFRRTTPALRQHPPPPLPWNPLLDLWRLRREWIIWHQRSRNISSKFCMQFLRLKTARLEKCGCFCREEVWHLVFFVRSTLTPLNRLKMLRMGEGEHCWTYILNDIRYVFPA